MPSHQKLLEAPIHRALLALAVPIVIGQILQSAYQLTDAFWVGRLGANQVAAVSVSMPVTFLVIALGSGLAMAGATLSAQYMGAKQYEKVNHVAAQTMLMVLITSVVLGFTGYLLSPAFLTLLRVESAVYQDALRFMHVSFSDGVISQNECTLDRVFELTDITWPVVCSDFLDRRVKNRFGFCLIGVAVRNKVLGQTDDITASFSQWRYR